LQWDAECQYAADLEQGGCQPVAAVESRNNPGKIASSSRVVCFGVAKTQHRLHLNTACCCARRPCTWGKHPCLPIEDNDAIPMGSAEVAGFARIQLRCELASAGSELLRVQLRGSSATSEPTNRSGPGPVIPAQAGIQYGRIRAALDPRLRGDDVYFGSLPAMQASDGVH
jgi:hypothetical protein